jgi:hypothetical protein|tara:strand:- start:509 stop:682 length:174 start_codon:yes stop_codon:yes gene_type:complete
MNNELIKHNYKLIKHIKTLNKKELIAIINNYYMPHQLRELIINLIKNKTAKARSKKT